MIPKTTKGQKISKANYGVLNSPKKRTLGKFSVNLESNCFRDLLTFITRWKNVIFKISVSKIFVFEWSFLQYFHFHFRNVSDNSIEIEGARLYTLCRRIIKVSFWTSSEFTSLHCDMPGFRFRHGRKNVKHCALCWCAKTLFKS